MAHAKHLIPVLEFSLDKAEDTLNDASASFDLPLLSDAYNRLSRWLSMLLETDDPRADLHTHDCRHEGLKAPGDDSLSLRQERMKAAHWGTDAEFEVHAGRCWVCDRLRLVAHLRRVAHDYVTSINAMITRENPRGCS